MDERLCQRLRRYTSLFVSPKRIDDGLQLMVHAGDVVAEPAHTLEKLTSESIDVKVADNTPLDLALHRIGQPCEVLVNRVLRIPSQRIKEIIVYRGSHRGEIEVLEHIRL